MAISQSSIGALKKKRWYVNKKTTAPLYKNNQSTRTKTGCKKLYKQLVQSGGEKCVIRDDETYVPCEKINIRLNSWFDKPFHKMASSVRHS